MSVTYAVQGIPLQGKSALPQRKEVTAWAGDVNNDHQVSLFLRALKAFKEMPVDDSLSYFQVAGIHGYPMVGWDGEKAEPALPQAYPPGYCRHNMINFPTWHRPYMVLYEQRLYEVMNDVIIKGWVDDGTFEYLSHDWKTWTLAASQFRLPYWDWAQFPKIPEICKQPQWSIIKPKIGGGTETHSFHNPLVAFQNPLQDYDPGKPEGQRWQNVSMGVPLMGPNAIPDDVNDPRDPDNTVYPTGQCIATSRYGIFADDKVTDYINGINNWDRMNVALKDPEWHDEHHTTTIQDAVGRMFSDGYHTTWASFASTAHNNPRDTHNSDYLSLEHIHNTLHNNIGGMYMKEPSNFPWDKKMPLGFGHMSDVTVAAFDPIFWLHHANIDRYLAIWQALNWDHWFDSEPSIPDSAKATNSTKGADLVKDAEPVGPSEKPAPTPSELTLPDPLPSDALTPFHSDVSGTPCTSDSVRDWRQLNYQYDTLADMPPDVEDLPSYVDSILKPRIHQLYPTSARVVKGLPEFKLGNRDEERFDDYIINVVYDRYALKGRAYSILFYLGKPTQPFCNSKADINFVGQVYTFSKPYVQKGKVSCANCHRQSAANKLSRAQIPLTLPLLRLVSPIQDDKLGLPENPFLGHLRKKKVEEALQHGLEWYFIEAGGILRDYKHFPETTQITVLKGEGRHSTPDKVRHSASDKVLPSFGNYQILEEATMDRPLGYGNKIESNELTRSDPKFC